MKNIGRLDDSKSVLKAIDKGILNSSIALHLILDIGNFYEHTSVFNIRYNEETLTFWTTVKKLFKGKGINFFRGYKASEKQISPADCKINFAVPSDPILAKHSAVYRLDAGMPGILNISLDVFAAKHDGKDVKLSIDCKKLALGYGQMGDEDLAGFECPPTLCERKNRHSNEVNTLHECSNILQNASLSKPEVVNDLSTVNSSLLKAALLASITHMSYRTREQLIVKKIALSHLLQVTGIKVS